MSPDDRLAVIRRDLKPVYDALITIRSQADPRQSPQIWEAAERAIVQLQGLGTFLAAH